MKKEMFVLTILTAGFLAVPLFADQTGCCSGMGTMPGCPAMSGQQSPDAMAADAASKLPEPVATVFDNYTRIQTALADDSLQDVATAAQAIEKSVGDDAAATFPKGIVQQAAAVAKAANLNDAREAFKSLSQSLIEYRDKNPQVAGAYRQVHCPMARADWLQKESTVNNPYFGKAMSRCGEFVNNQQ